MRKFNKPYPKVFIKHIQGEIQNLAEDYNEEDFYIGKYLGELVLIERKCDEDRYLIQLDNPNIGWSALAGAYEIDGLKQNKTYWWLEPENIHIKFNNNLMDTE